MSKADNADRGACRRDNAISPQPPPTGPNSPPAEKVLGTVNSPREFVGCAVHTFFLPVTCRRNVT